MIWQTPVPYGDKYAYDLIANGKFVQGLLKMLFQSSISINFPEYQQIPR